MQKSDKQAIKQAPDDAPIPLSQAASFLRISYQWAWQLTQIGELVQRSVAQGERAVYVTAESVRLRKAKQESDDATHKRTMKAIDTHPYDTHLLSAPKKGDA